MLLNKNLPNCSQFNLTCSLWPLQTEGGNAPNAVSNCHVNPHLPFVKYFKGELVHFVDKNVTSGTKYLQ